MRIRNINGTSEASCKCGSWLQHWLNFSHRPLPRYCSEVNCVQRPTVGAHVQVEWALDDRWYIVPLCAGHNAMKGGSIELVPSTVLVRSSGKDTCGT